MAESDYDCIVIGGGFAGLGTAWNLARSGRTVLLLEASADLGGLVSSYKFPTFTIEKYYHHFFPADRDLFEVIQALGLEDRVRYCPGSVGYFVGGRIYPLDTPWQILRFKALSFMEKFMLSRLMKAAQAADEKEMKRLDHVSAVDWIREVAGEGVLENFFAPLLRGKFGDVMDEIGAAWLAARVALRSRGRNIFKGETLCYFEGGFETLVQALVKDVSASCEVRTSERVKQVLIEDGRAVGVETESGSYRSKSVVAALTPALLTRLAELPDDEAQRLTDIRFQACSCAVVGVKKSVIPVYWLNINSASCPFDVMLQHNRLWNEPGYDCTMLYLATYHSTPSDPAFNRSEEEIKEAFLSGLENEFGWNRDDFLWWRLARSPAAGPIYRKGYLENLPEHHTSVAGLWHASMVHSFPERSTADSLRQGRVVASMVNEYLS